jgi:outer membrane protein assembly factor BamB
VAHDKVKDAEPADPKADEEAGEQPADQADQEASSEKTGGTKTAGTTSTGKRTTKSARKKQREADRAAVAAHARAVMQRRHLRIGLAMAAGIGAEVAGAAGLVAGSLQPWEWGERLWGQTDRPALAIQIGIALTLLGLVAAWLLWRSEKAPARLRVVVLPVAAAVGAVAAIKVWQADPGSRGPGGVVVTVAAVLVVAGALTWLIGLQRLRKLFPFGLADARAKGYGNLAAVRRARLVGGPAVAVGGAAVVAVVLVAAPGLVTTEDVQTAGPLALDGAPPAADGAPQWTMDVASSPDGRPAKVWATPGGLVVEELQGARGVDPRDGSVRWHWRDDAYTRVASVATDQGRTVVLGLQYNGDRAGRDRVVALDSATGEVQWERFDDELVTAMATTAAAPADGDWFVVPVVEEAPENPQDPSYELHGVGPGGDRLWVVTEDEGCRFMDVDADSPGVVVSAQRCFDETQTNLSCFVRGLGPADGATRWTWPAEPAADPAQAVSECQATPTERVVLVSYTQQGEQRAVALDPATGEQVWSLGDEDAVGLSNVVLVGDALVGMDQPAEGTAGPATLVIRDAATGEVREELELPAGQPIGTVVISDTVAGISHYLPDTAEVQLLQVDVPAATVGAPLLVGTAPEGASLRQVTVTVGPEAMTVDLLSATADPAGTETYQLVIHGW